MKEEEKTNSMGMHKSESAHLPAAISFLLPNCCHSYMKLPSGFPTTKVQQLAAQKLLNNSFRGQGTDNII